jgi:hypothetical protein
MTRPTPHLATGAGAVGPDVGVADLMAARAFGRGLLSQLLRRLPMALACRRDPPRANPCTRKTQRPSSILWYDALIGNLQTRGEECDLRLA